MTSSPSRPRTAVLIATPPFDDDQLRLIRRARAQRRRRARRVLTRA